MSKLSTCLYHANSATKMRREVWPRAEYIRRTLMLAHLSREDMDATDWELLQDGMPPWGWHSPEDED